MEKGNFKVRYSIKSQIVIGSRLVKHMKLKITIGLACDEKSRQYQSEIQHSN